MSAAPPSFPMKPVFIAFLLLCLGSSAPVATSNGSVVTEDHALIALQHEEWMARHGRVYKDEAEKAVRLEIFKSNLQYIESFNRAGNRTFKLGLTPFTDLTNEEFNAKINCGLIPPPDPKRIVPTRRPNVNLTDLPEFVDWWLGGLVTPSEDQGDCASCWAFAGTTVVETAVMIKTELLIPLSKQQLVDCDVTRQTRGCSGGTDSDVFNYIIRNGITTDENYPYVARDEPCDVDKADEPVSIITDYGLVVPNDEVALMERLAIQPTYATVLSGSMELQNYKEGVFSGDCGTSNHAVAVVGYGTEINDVEFWTMKNSWGPDWGEDGFWRISREATPDGQGMCKILRRNTYPVA